jgi:Protein of unknown function (DUF3996)
VRRISFLFAGLLLLMTCGPAHAQKGLGVGVILGEPTGISLKAWINEKQAVDVAAAWSYFENDSFEFHGDYLIHRYGTFKNKDFRGKLPLYFGVGGRFKLKSDNGHGRNDHDALVGARVPFGISYLFPDDPVDLFFEVVPILDLAPDTHFDLSAAVGARFYLP